MAFGAGMSNELASASAIGAGGLDAEKALCANDLSCSPASPAGLGSVAGFSSGALAGSAGIMLADFHLFLSSKSSFLKGDRDIQAQIRSASLPFSSSAKEVTKNIPKLGEDIIESTESTKATSLKAFMAELVIDLSFLRVFKDIVSL